AALELLSPRPLCVRPGEPAGLRVRARNTGDRPWRFRPTLTAGVHVGFHVWDEQDVQVAMDKAGLYDAEVPPGGSIEVTLALPARTQLVSTLRWQILARALGVGRPLRQLVGMYFIGMYFNLLLPSSVGGDVVRAWYLDGGSKRRLAAFASVFLDRLSGLLVLLAMACVALVLSPLALPAWVSLFVWGSVAVSLLALAAVPLLAG